MSNFQRNISGPCSGHGASFPSTGPLFRVSWGCSRPVLQPACPGACRGSPQAAKGSVSRPHVLCPGPHAVVSLSDRGGQTLGHTELSPQVARGQRPLTGLQGWRAPEMHREAPGVRPPPCAAGVICRFGTSPPQAALDLPPQELLFCVLFLCSPRSQPDPALLATA